MPANSRLTISRRDFLRLVGPAAAALGLAACTSTPSPPTPATPASPVAGSQPAAAPAVGAAPEKARVGLWSQPITEQSNLLAAREFGWFKEEGLELELIPGAGGGDAIKQVLAGNADLAFANLEPMFFAIEQGSKLRAVWNIYPENVFNVIALKDRGITSPRDLKGKKVGVYSQASGTRYNLLVMLRSVGLKESDVEVVATGIANFAPLQQGQVDAQAATDTGLYAAQRAGLKEVNVIWARDYLNTPTDAFVVLEQLYQGRKDFLRRFLRAYRRGTQWMLDNPEKAAELAKQQATDGQDVARNLDIIKIRNRSTVNDDTRQHGLGWFNVEILKKVEETFFDLGLTTKRLDVSSAFTNEFVSAS